MEVSSSNIRRYNDEESLRTLLEAFGSLFSIEEISSAYHKAGQNADLAGQILYDIQERTSDPPSHELNQILKCKESIAPYYKKVSSNPLHDGKSKASRQKWMPVSAGSVSSVIGKDYVKVTPVANDPSIASKPIKLDEKEFPSKVWGEQRKQTTVKNNYMHGDMADFLFKLLGNGFKLDRDVIRQVLDNCGYDMQKSMEKLLDLSADTLEKGKKSGDNCKQKFPVSDQKSVERSYSKDLEQENFPEGAASNGKGLAKQAKGKNDLEKELLVSLFNGTEKSDLPRRVPKSNRRSIALGKSVAEPLREEIKDPVVQQENLNDEDEHGEDNYEELRKAVKEYRTTMKEYYRSAVAAFVQGDHDRANKLIDQGHFFFEKARQADKESSREIFINKNTEKDYLVLDLHAHGAKEVIRPLKCHISSLAGSPSFAYLKVIVEKNEDFTKGMRRRVVTKLLEKESIKWIQGEGEDAGSIVVRLDSIKRSQLSFTKS